MENITNRNMTILSQNAYREATVKLKSKEDAVRYLRTELITRNIRSNLEKMAEDRNIKDVQKCLVEGILEIHPEKDPESVKRLVRGWVNEKGKSSINDREEAIELPFILHAGLEKADEFIALTSESKLHWRSPEEIVYIFGLKHGWTYLECRELIESSDIQEVIRKVASYRTIGKVPEKAYTDLVRMDIEKIDTEDELITYLKENYTRLGTFHNTAYEMFMGMMAKLEFPATRDEDLLLFEEFDKPERYTVKDILREYLYRDTVNDAKQRALQSKRALKNKEITKEQQYTLDLIQKKICDSWPDASYISQMKKRTKDISRKCLILLFIATDGDYDEENYGSDDDLDGEAVYIDMAERLDDMLYYAGFTPLDPRNPFDWLIIYCIYVNDLLDVDPRLLSMLEELFSA